MQTDRKENIITENLYVIGDYMQCKVDGCDRDIAYKEQQVCQKHYFRFMRNGHYGLKPREEKKMYSRVRRYRTQNLAGYQKLYEPNHPLAESGGDVYEHRFVYYNEVNSDPKKCESCGDEINWDNLHIDHKDEDVSNNKPENLRALCRGCNVFRGHSATSMGSHVFTVDGKSMNAFIWARQPDVLVSGATILRRRRVLGMNDYDCIYAPRVTHHNTVCKPVKTKHDDIRLIRERKKELGL